MSRAVGFAIVFAVGALMSASTAARVRLWANPPELWMDAARKAQQKPRPWINLGNEYAQAGLTTQAATAYGRAMSIAPQRRLPEERAYGMALGAANLSMFDVDRGDVATALARIRAIPPSYRVTSVVDLERWYERQLASSSSLP